MTTERNKNIQQDKPRSTTAKDAKAKAQSLNQARNTKALEASAKALPKQTTQAPVQHFVKVVTELNGLQEVTLFIYLEGIILVWITAYEPT